jgi:hypothetical protein
MALSSLASPTALSTLAASSPLLHHVVLFSVGLLLSTTTTTTMSSSATAFLVTPLHQILYDVMELRRSPTKRLRFRARVGADRSSLRTTPSIPNYKIF